MECPGQSFHLAPSRRLLYALCVLHLAALAGLAATALPPTLMLALATLTWLFEGALLHRDSLGSRQVIRPGDLNWMTAGCGIVHSERTPSPEWRCRAPARSPAGSRCRPW